MNAYATVAIREKLTSENMVVMTIENLQILFRICYCWVSKTFESIIS